MPTRLYICKKPIEWRYFTTLVKEISTMYTLPSLPFLQVGKRQLDAYLSLVQSGERITFHQHLSEELQSSKCIPQLSMLIEILNPPKSHKIQAFGIPVHLKPFPPSTYVSQSTQEISNQFLVILHPIFTIRLCNTLKPGKLSQICLYPPSRNIKC